MKLKKIVFFVVMVCLFNIFSFSVLLANPLLKADKKQLEAWGFTEQHIGLGFGAKLDFLAYEIFATQLKKKFNVQQITVNDILNPAFKIHFKKEFGIPVTSEDIAMAEKKWSANPILEADSDLLNKWLAGSACKTAYTKPGEEKFTPNGYMDLCTRRAIPQIMLDTGVEMSVEAFSVPAVIEKARKVLSRP